MRFATVKDGTMSNDNCQFGKAHRGFCVECEYATGEQNPLCVREMKKDWPNGRPLTRNEQELNKPFDYRSLFR